MSNLYILDPIEQHLAVPAHIGKVLPVICEQLPLALNILARNQLVAAVLNQPLDALKSRVKMELQPDYPATTVLKRLIPARIRLCDPCCARRQVECVAVPVKHCEPFREPPEHTGFACSVSEPNIEPSDLGVLVLVDFRAENACDQLGAEADSENDLSRVDRVSD